MELKKYNVTVARFDPTQPFIPGTAESFILPVDSPDEEHGIAAAMSNCVAFTPKFEGGKVKAVAFTCLEVASR